MKGARYLRRFAFTLAAILTVFSILFAGGEAMSDPGGLEGAGLVATWLVPLVVLLVVARRFPAHAVIVLGAVALGIVGMHLWAAADPQWFDATEDRIGPIRAVVSFAALGPIAVLALKRTAFGGAALVVLGLVPIALSGLAPSSEPMRILGTAIAVIGAIFLASAALGRGTTPPIAEHGTEGYRQAA